MLGGCEKNVCYNNITKNIKDITVLQEIFSNSIAPNKFLGKFVQ